MGKYESGRSNPSGTKLIELDDLAETAEGVYYSPYSLPLVDVKVIEFLKRRAGVSPRRRARFCAHLSPNAEQHDMLIVSHRDTYVTPHRHMSKSETFIVLEGSAEIILFEETGEIEKIVDMGPAESGKPFFYRMPPRRFHSLAIKSELLVFLESTMGPFNLDDREHASWAPHPDDTENGQAYIAGLVGRVAHGTETPAAKKDYR